jgi:hypothetical protein
MASKVSLATAPGSSASSSIASRSSSGSSQRAGSSKKIRRRTSSAPGPRSRDEELQADVAVDVVAAGDRDVDESAPLSQAQRDHESGGPTEFERGGLVAPLTDLVLLPAAAPPGSTTSSHGGGRSARPIRASSRRGRRQREPRLRPAFRTSPRRSRPRVVVEEDGVESGAGLATTPPRRARSRSRVRGARDCRHRGRRAIGPMITDDVRAQPATSTHDGTTAATTRAHKHGSRILVTRKTDARSHAELPRGVAGCHESDGRGHYIG